MLRYAVDEINSDRVVGWLFDPDAQPEVTVFVDGKPVGRARPGGYRVDVAISLDDDRAQTSGFEFRFDGAHFNHVAGDRAEVALRIGDEQTAPIAVPVVTQHHTTVSRRAPLPPEVVALLGRYSGRYLVPEWDDDLAIAAVGDIGFLLERGPRRAPQLHRYLSFIAQLWIRAASVERYFPRENESADAGDKDRSGIQNSGLEVFAIGVHLATLDAHGVQGPFLEFGCFKGFSTAILSDACHQLGIDMHVFDSFEGLPPSDSVYYNAGEFAGSLDEVRRNVDAYGRPSVITYHKGFFSDSLPGFASPPPMAMWMDVDLESSSRDVMAILPRLDRRGVLFSHECPPEVFTGGGIDATRSPEAVVPPVLDAFAAAGRRVRGRHIHGNTGAFWDADHGIPPLPTRALSDLRTLALAL
jgi:O-methyltransferase